MTDPTKLRDLANWLEHEWGYLIGAPDARIGECIEAMRDAAKEMEPIPSARDGRWMVGNITLDITLGTSIDRVARYALDLNRRTGHPVHFTFNGCDFEVNNTSTLESIEAVWGVPFPQSPVPTP